MRAAAYDRQWFDEKRENRDGIDRIPLAVGLNQFSEVPSAIEVAGTEVDQAPRIPGLIANDAPAAPPAS